MAFIAGVGGASGAIAVLEAEKRVFALGFLILEPSEFLKLLEKVERPVVLYTVKREGILSKKDTYTYVAKYGEFTILTKTETPLTLPSKVELILVKDIVLPSEVQAHLNSIAKRGGSTSSNKH